MRPDERGVSRLVVKVGASVLTDSAGRPAPARLRHIADQLADSRSQQRRIVLVSSGAVACGMARLGFRHRPRQLDQLQACAAVGQGELMHRYSQAFATHRVSVAQVLLTQADLSDRARCANARQTLKTLLELGVVPIINENDAVTVEEITFGDNDRLAALVACLIRAELLVILSDVDGLMQGRRVIERIDRLNHEHEALALGNSRETTTGGMASKLAAARVAGHAGIPLIIANGTKRGILLEILKGRPVGTLISPPARTLRFRKWWIAFSTRRPLGAVTIDRGAADALLHRGHSLLASGIRDVRGRFHSGDPIAVVDESEMELARGISSFSSSELARIRGLRSHAVGEALGRDAPAEVIHRDNLVLLKELNA
ncbi:MAG: glutamate 5-kinase [Candidatus Omnitrophica bacterium]|nr:glutamate 5-kinase [Candidatus Omnitrophota bacterium]